MTFDNESLMFVVDVDSVYIKNNHKAMDAKLSD